MIKKAQLELIYPFFAINVFNRTNHKIKDLKLIDDEMLQDTLALTSLTEKMRKRSMFKLVMRNTKSYYQ